jgi:hypothetical protein
VAKKKKKDKGAVDVGKVMKAGKRSGIKKTTIRAIHERMNDLCLNAIGGWQDTPLNPHMPDGEKLVILIQAVGNVADAMRDDTPQSLQPELIKTATLVAAWAEANRKGGSAWAATT